MPEVKLLLDPNPDLTKPQARRRHRPTASRGGKGHSREDLRGGLVAKAVPGVRVAVGKTLSPGNTVSWTRLAGKHCEAGQPPTCWPVPGAPRRLGTQASAQTRCSSALQALCVGKGMAQPPGSAECGRERRNRIPEILHRDVPQREVPGVKEPVPSWVCQQRQDAWQRWWLRGALLCAACTWLQEAEGDAGSGRPALGPGSAGSGPGGLGRPERPLEVGIITLPTSLEDSLAAVCEAGSTF